MLNMGKNRENVMATWRNGSAFGFDCQRHQKVAGSSPAVVIFYRLSYAYPAHVTLSRLSRQGSQLKDAFYLPQRLNRPAITRTGQTRHGHHTTLPAFI
jgi:hypothetical protein